MIYISGIVISVFLSILLLLKKNRSKEDVILFAWMILITIHQLFFYFDHSNYFRQYTFLIGFDFAFPLMHGPFLFLYASALVGIIPKRNWIWIAHFIPAIINYLLMLSFFRLSAEQKLYVVDHDGEGYVWFLQIRFIAIIFSGIIYVLLTLLVLRRHQKRIRENFSDIEKINLQWLQYLTYGIGIIWLAVIFGTEQLTFAVVVVFVIFIGVYGIRQTHIFTGNNIAAAQPNGNAMNLVKSGDVDPDEASGFDSMVVSKKEFEKTPFIEPLSESPEAKGKYEKSGLSESDQLNIKYQLVELMENEKLYTAPELTLGDVAQKLKIHPNYLSQVINTLLHKNFYDYINEQRVAEFLRVVQDPKQQHFTLLSLAFGCGFNSKSSFNRNFRKVMGVSPSVYLDQAKIIIENAE